MTIRPISRLLIANRGEIACRIIRTAHAMGIEVVAICCSDDRESPHVAKADIATTVDSYLDGAGIIAIAKRFGVDAIHPGYGFLAENAAFAAEVVNSGVLFIGPSAKTIAALGSKLSAGSLAHAAGIPMIPRLAIGNETNDNNHNNNDPTAPAFPLMIKPSAGGGGKGMTIVRSADQLDGAIDSAKRLAQAAFGCEDLIIERYIEAGRHIEVQILADQWGNIIHLGERECSIQRRHQKVIEEAPAPNLSPGLREKICAAAVGLAQAVDYQSAGTVEFIVADDESFYFLEVNTRLQVEHAVTEMTTGIDIVGEQIRIAEGHPLSITQSEIEFSGAAIETRIYAENPSAGDLPTTGMIQYLDLPSNLPSIRIDCGIRAGQRIGINYDPMLLKVIAHGRDREQARTRLVMSLADLELAGVTTNKEALVAVLQTTTFRCGDLHTGFWDQHQDALTAPPSDRLWAAAAAAYICNKNKRKQTALEHLPPGFRLNGWAPQISRVSLGANPSAPIIEIRFRWVAHGQYNLTVQPISRSNDATSGPEFDRPEFDRPEFDNVQHKGTSIDGTVHIIENTRQQSVELWDADGRRHRFTVRGTSINDGFKIVTEHKKSLTKELNERVFVHGEGADFVFMPIPRFEVLSQTVQEGACVAPMPGRVVAVHVEVGDHVNEGQLIVVLEAMKMEHPVTAPHPGAVAALSVTIGDQVDSDHILAVISPDNKN